MARATEPCAPRTYRVGRWRIGTHRFLTGRVLARRVLASRAFAALSIGVGALLPFAQAASWDRTPLPPPPVQQVPEQTSPTQAGRLQPGDIVSLQVIPYRE